MPLSILRARRGKGGPKGAKRTGQGSCHLKLKLYGHLRHRDNAGSNRLRFTKSTTIRSRRVGTASPP